jgi:hypothetical protein
MENLILFKVSSDPIGIAVDKGHHLFTACGIIPGTDIYDIIYNIMYDANEFSFFSSVRGFPAIPALSLHLHPNALQLQLLPLVAEHLLPSRLQDRGQRRPRGLSHRITSPAVSPVVLVYGHGSYDCPLCRLDRPQIPLSRRRDLGRRCPRRLAGHRLFYDPHCVSWRHFPFHQFCNVPTWKYGSHFGPYAFFLSGFTLLTVETSALSRPWKAWTFALSRGEEVFVGILAALVVGLIIWPRHPLPEFQEILRSICRESDFLVRCDINDLIDSPRVDAQRRQSQRLLLRQILRLQSVLAALGREGLNLSANIALLSKACHSINRVVRAVIDLQDLHGHQVNSTINDLGLTTEFGRVEASIGRALSDLPNQLKPDLTDLSEAVNQLDARVRQFLESSTAGSVQVDDLSALLRRWNILKEIYEELTVLKQFKGQLKQTRLDNRLAPGRLKRLRRFQRPKRCRWPRPITHLRLMQP